MFERNISVEDIAAVLKTGEVIENYPDDLPYPSRLVLGNAAGRAIHVVFAMAPEVAIVVTCYEPDPELWDEGLRRRKT